MRNQDNALTESGIDLDALRRISAAWPRRATIRSHMESLAEPPDPHDPAVPDYPEKFLPFAEHPDFLAASSDQRQLVLTYAWLLYNARVITAEEQIANPTFAMIVHGVFPGSERIEIKQAVQQAHVDETWHTYMHMMAMHRSREVRGITSEPALPHAVTYRELVSEQEETGDRRQRDLLSLAWTTVTEVSVNAYLELLSRDETIQPMHSLVPRLHARDETAHGSVMAEVVRELYANMSRSERETFARALPRAVRAFGMHDFAAWPGILRHAGIAKATDIVEDCRRAIGNNLLVRDFSAVERMVREMDIDPELVMAGG
ncbi:diiron oxygenase [Nonomuraea sp. SYSU D8015]|uniref:diiron oxygenase n=1 Tax=Nonomuraea sp. SYSU D8015 TaxID=2593644 RepID=UPI001660BEE6|nr:diiron oxygenase [Nonomuraea sp. SYSU D8015]